MGAQERMTATKERTRKGDFVIVKDIMRLTGAGGFESYDVIRFRLRRALKCNRSGGLVRYIHPRYYPDEGVGQSIRYSHWWHQPKAWTDALTAACEGVEEFGLGDREVLEWDTLEEAQDAVRQMSEGKHARTIRDGSPISA